jgi:hypothetical protein
MRTSLTNAAFGGPTASEQNLKAMIARGQRLLAQASALAANSQNHRPNGGSRYLNSGTCHLPIRVFLPLWHMPADS